MKNKTQLDGMPVWFDGKSINEALFCEEFLQTHKIIFTNGAFFTPEGRVTDLRHHNQKRRRTKKIHISR